jgi:DNA-binding PadR family transcriptional regulator
MDRTMPRFPEMPSLLDAASFEAEAAAVAALGNLKSEGPATARDLVRRIERAATVAGEPVLPFKHATVYAVLHELEFDGAVGRAQESTGERPTYALASRGRALLTLCQERWRAAHLVIRAAAAVTETVRS